MTLTRGCGRIPGQFAARLLNGLANGDGPQRDLGGRDDGAGDGEHQRGGIAKVAVELDGPSAARQLQLVHLQVHVAEFLLLVLDVVVELDVNHRQPGEAERANAEVGWARRFDSGVLRGRLLHGAGDELLDLFGRGARPLALGRRHPDGDVRVLALGHVVVAIPAPNEGRHQQDQANLTVLGEEAGSVVRGRDDLSVGLVMDRHCASLSHAYYKNLLPLRLEGARLQARRNQGSSCFEGRSFSHALSLPNGCAVTTPLDLSSRTDFSR